MHLRSVSCGGLLNGSFAIHPDRPRQMIRGHGMLTHCNEDVARAGADCIVDDLDSNG